MPVPRAGGIPAQNADFIRAVYGNAWWIIALIVAVTFGLLARALRSIVLPVKALVLNVLSTGAAYGITVLIWQHGAGTQLLFNQTTSGVITVWVPIAVLAFLFACQWTTKCSCWPASAKNTTTTPMTPPGTASPAPAG